MNKKERHTTIYPYYDKENFNYYYDVSKLHNLKAKSQLVVLLDSIGRKAKDFDSFQFLYNIHIQGDWEMVKKSVLQEMDHKQHRAYCMLEVHMDQPVMGSDKFYNYLKKRIQEEFYGDIQFAICWKEEDAEKIVLIFNDMINIPRIYF